MNQMLSTSYTQEGLTMKRTIYLLGLLCAVSILQACGGMSTLRGAEKLVETSGSEPKLVARGQGCVVNKEDRVCVGLADQAHDLDAAVRIAELEGKKHIVESIATELRVEGTRGLSGPEKEAVGRFFEDSFSWVTDNIRVSGATLDQSYWEKWARTNGPQVSYYYRAYGIVRINEADYLTARDQAINGLIDKAIREKNRQAEKAARDTKERLLQPKLGDE
jgi:hypothetical protein